MVRKKSHFLTLALLNVRSLRTGHDEFVANLDRYKPDVVALNETWLRAGEENFLPSVPGYSLKSNPRQSGHRGGGVGFYIRRGVQVRIVQHPPSTLEQMWLELRVRGVGSFAIGTAYRPESVTVDSATDALSETLDIFGSCRGVFLLSDFNVNLLSTNKPSVAKLLTFLKHRNLEQLVSEPTRITDQSASILDLVITDSPNLCKDIHIHHNPRLSDHAMILVKLCITKPKLSPQYIYRRNLGKIDSEEFEQDVNNMPWYEILAEDDVNKKVKRFNELITLLFDKHSPLCKLRVSRQSYPWITDNIKCMMKLRDSAFARARRTGVRSHHEYYKSLRNYINGALEREKTAYFTYYVNKNRSHPAQMWTHLKSSAVIGDAEKPAIPHHLCVPDTVNDFFLKLPGNSETHRDTQAWFSGGRLGSFEFHIKKCTEEQVLKSIQSIKTNAKGHDGISMEMIRLTLKTTLPIIAHMVNSSIEHGIFPEDWKIAKVRPIPKSNKTEDLKDLRPISILPALSKIIEKIVCDQLAKYLENNELLPIVQSGFRGKHGTATALAKVTDDVITASDKGMGTVLVLLDFSRAFDCLNPTLLIAKMRYYGVSDLSCQWFQSFLSNRQQFVELQTEQGSLVASSTRSISRGTPQGSILSPLLFVLYTSDLVARLKHCGVHLYADDTQLYYSLTPQDLDTALAKINEDLSAVADWSVKNNLVLNPNKSQFIVLGSKGQRDKILAQKPVIFIGNEPVSRVDQVKNLGLVMDGEMRYIEHINIKIRNAFYRLKTLYSLRKYLSVGVRETVAEALVLSHLNYGDIVYGPRLLEKTKKVIQRLQNACVRFCYDVPRRAHITPYLNDRGILNMANRRNLHLAFTVRKVIEFEKPRYLFNVLKWVKDDRKKPLRSHRATKLIVPEHRTVSFRGGFKFAATKIWNDLPPPLREPMPLLKFKKILKSHFLKQQKQI